jgi:hypothetical protein
MRMAKQLQMFFRAISFSMFYFGLPSAVVLNQQAVVLQNKIPCCLICQMASCNKVVMISFVYKFLKYCKPIN